MVFDTEDAVASISELEEGLEEELDFFVVEARAGFVEDDEVFAFSSVVVGVGVDSRNLAGYFDALGFAS